MKAEETHGTNPVPLWTAVLALAGSLAGLPVLGATAPYLETFDAYDNGADPDVVPAEFSELQGATWSIQNDGAGKDYQNERTDVNNTPSTLNISYQWAYLPITGVAGNDFMVSAEMSIDESSSTGNSGNNASLGLMLLSPNDFDLGYNCRVDALNSGIGTISITEDGATRATGSTPISLVGGIPYTLTVQGTYDGSGDLTLLFEMTDGVSTVSVSYVDASPRSGSRFGFLNTLLTWPGGSSTSIDVDFDNLMVDLMVPPVTLDPGVISGVSIAAGEVNLSLEELTVGATQHVLRAPSLDSTSWMTTDTFTATASTESWSEPVPSSFAVYGIRSEM